jgi:ABC-type uncharacterized transport system involved in gliding motility auxiliary subunit
MAMRRPWPWRRAAAAGGEAPAEAPVAGAVRPPLDRRGLVRTGTLGASVLLVLALAVFVNYFGWKYHHRFDWTASQLYSLSQRTEQVLASLDEDVEVFVFLPSGDELYEPTRELLARYEDASPHVSVRVLDPERNVLEVGRLAEQYGIDRPAVVFTDGTEQRVVARTDLAEYDFAAMQFGGGQPEIEAFRGEQQFTRALVELTERSKPRVYFTVGHGELRLDDQGAGGLQELQRILGADSFTFEEWATLGAEAVPEDADLVVVAGPGSSFLPPELELLGRYLDRGGRLLALLDPPIVGRPERVGSTGLEDWLVGYGVAVGANVVVDRAGGLLGFGPETFFANRYPDPHPINEGLRRDELPVLLRLARSVGEGTPPPDFTATTLLATSDEGWGETDLADVARGEDDLPGPVPLGVVVAPRDATGGEEEAALDPAGGGEPAAAADGFRIVVLGDAELATDQFLVQNFGNQVLLTSAVNWLVEREALVGIPPRARERVGLTLSAAQLRWVYLLALLVLPGLVLVAGVTVHYRRRR